MKIRKRKRKRQKNIKKWNQKRHSVPRKTKVFFFVVVVVALEHLDSKENSVVISSLLSNNISPCCECSFKSFCCCVKSLCFVYLWINSTIENNILSAITINISLKLDWLWALGKIEFLIFFHESWTMLLFVKYVNKWKLLYSSKSLFLFEWKEIKIFSILRNKSFFLYIQVLYCWLERLSIFQIKTLRLIIFLWQCLRNMWRVALREKDCKYKMKTHSN